VPRGGKCENLALAVQARKKMVSIPAAREDPYTGMGCIRSQGEMVFRRIGTLKCPRPFDEGEVEALGQPGAMSSRTRPGRPMIMTRFTVPFSAGEESNF
jgi:hypothetical protein